MTDILAQVRKTWPDQAACVSYLESLRWPDGPVCPYCADDNARTSVNDRWHCTSCNRHFSVRVDTVFHHSHVDFHRWFALLFYVTANQELPSVSELSRRLSIKRSTVASMTTRLRDALGRGDPLLDGLVAYWGKRK